MSGFMSRLDMDDDQVAYTLLEHMRRQGYAGLDKSTVNHNPRLQRVMGLFGQGSWAARGWRSLVARSARLAGHRLHPLLRPEKRVFAKGLALAVSAYSHLLLRAGVEKRAEIREEVARLFELLEAKRLSPGHVWAHDYPYRLYDAEATLETPNLVTTAFVALAAWDWWCNGGDGSARELFLNIVRDIKHVFPQREQGDGLCFMYVPSSNYHVHNANLLAAELTARAYAVTGATEDREIVRRALTYTLADFRRTGSFPYAGPPTANPAIDNYHTGYVLRSLHSIAGSIPELSQEFDIDEVLTKGLRFYVGRFAGPIGVRFAARGPLESHGLAEAILMHKEFEGAFDPADRERLGAAIRKTAAVLWDAREQRFLYTATPLPLGMGMLLDRTDFVRWSQAWMAYALAATPARRA